MRPQTKWCEKCEKKESVAGLNGLWVCQECFEEGLQGTGRRLSDLVWRMGIGQAEIAIRIRRKRRTRCTS